MAHPGFIGSAWIQTNATTGGWPATGGSAGTTMNLFLSGGSLNPVQEINAPDNLIQGQVVKHVANYGKVEIGGNIQAPIDENHKSLFNSAWFRQGSSGAAGQFPDRMKDQAIIVKISYYRAASNNARIFNNLAIATYEVSVTAGDVATFTAEFMGASNYAGGVLTPALNIDTFNSPAPATKLVTWDRCKFQMTGINMAVQSFTFSVNNNLTRVYKVRSSNSVAQANDPAATLYPTELVAGFRDLTGTVVAFAGDAGTGDTITDGAPEAQFQPAGWTGNDPIPANQLFGAENWGAYTINNMKVPINFVVGEGLPTPIINVAFQAIFKRPDAQPKTDLQTYSLTYQGIAYDSL